jgi:hypothetical protein
MTCLFLSVMPGTAKDLDVREILLRRCMAEGKCFLPRYRNEARWGIGRVESGAADAPR